MPYPVGQPPVLITFASEGDWANRSAFPLGRYVSVVTTLELPRNRAQLNDIVHAVGHIDRLATHRLYVGAPLAHATSAPPPPTIQNERARQDMLRDEQQRFARVACEESRPQPDWERRYSNGVVLKHQEGKTAPDNPFWVVPTDAAILNGHNDLWRPSSSISFRALQ